MQRSMKVPPRIDMLRDVLEQQVALGPRPFISERPFTASQ